MALIPIHKRVAAVEAALADLEGACFGYEPEACDCVRFPARVIVNATGRDPLGALTWSDETSAILAVRSDAGTLSAAISKRFAEIPPAQALPGDLVGFESADGDEVFDVALGVFDGDRGLFWLDSGLRRIPLPRASIAWRLA